MIREAQILQEDNNMDRFLTNTQKVTDVLSRYSLPTLFLALAAVLIGLWLFKRAMKKAGIVLFIIAVILFSKGIIDIVMIQSAGITLWGWIKDFFPA